MSNLNLTVVEILSPEYQGIFKMKNVWFPIHEFETYSFSKKVIKHIRKVAYMVIHHEMKNFNEVTFYIIKEGCTCRFAKGMVEVEIKVYATGLCKIQYKYSIGDLANYVTKTMPIEKMVEFVNGFENEEF